MKKISLFSLFFLGIFSSSAFAAVEVSVITAVKGRIENFRDIDELMRGRVAFSTEEGDYEKCYVKRRHGESQPPHELEVRESDIPLSPTIKYRYESYQTFTVQFPRDEEIILVGICKKKRNR